MNKYNLLLKKYNQYSIFRNIIRNKILNMLLLRLENSPKKGEGWRMYI